MTSLAGTLDQCFDDSGPVHLTQLSSRMNPGELLTIWLVRISMGCYLLSECRRLTARQDMSRLRTARSLWSVGYVFFLLHLLTAFHFVHHWSHAHAFEVTARRTQQTIGVPYGEGIYFNYAFMLVWGIDVLWWWSGLQRYQSRPRWVSLLIHGGMLFIVVNATILFAITGIRWAGIAGLLLLAGIRVTRRSQN